MFVVFLYTLFWAIVNLDTFWLIHSLYSSLKYIWPFLVMVECLLVPVIPRAKPSGVSTPVGLFMVVRSKRKDQSECNQSTENSNGRVGKNVHDLNGQAGRRRQCQSMDLNRPSI